MTYGYSNSGSGWRSSWGYSSANKGYGGYDGCGGKGGYGGSSWGGSSWGGSKGGSSWGSKDDHGWGGSKGGSSWGGKDDCGWGGSKGGSSWGGSKGGSSRGGSSWGGKDDHGWGGSKGGGSWGGKGGCGPQPDPTPDFALGDEGRTCHFTLESGGLTLIVTVTEFGNALKFDIKIADDSAKVGDLRGLFFNLDVADGADLFVLSGDDVTDSKFGDRNVDDLGGGVNVRGPGGGYDVGVEFGTSGIGKDDVQETSFILANANGALTLDDLDDNAVAARLTSVGYEGSCRNDSLKIVGETGDLDCDVFEANTPPEPADDAAGVCAGAATTIDLLANDVDPDAELGPEDDYGLTIAAVYTVTGAQYFTDLAPGEWITLDSGARVQLVDGELVYDSAGAFDDLLIGQKATDTFEYAVYDADGDPGFAEVTVSICGSLNLVETITNDAPGYATMDIDQILSSLTGRLTNSVSIDFTDPAYDALDGVYTNAYCIDRSTPANLLLTGAQVFDSTDPGNLPAGLVDKPDMLDEVNWLLNQDFESTYSLTDVQSAIWALIDDAGGVDTNRAPGVQLSAGAQAMYDQAILQDGFVVDPSDPAANVKGMIFLPVDGAGNENGQAFIIGFELEDCLCAGDALV